MAERSFPAEEDLGLNLGNIIFIEHFFIVF